MCDTVTLKNKIFHLQENTPDHDKDELYSSAYSIVEKGISSVHNLVSHSAKHDLKRLLAADLSQLQSLEGQDEFVDPTIMGPLGELWLGSIPAWYSQISSDFESLLDTYKQEINQRVQNSSVRCNPEDLADEFCHVFESISYERLPNPCPFLRDLVVNAYDASLQFEEGRTVRFQLKFESTPNSLDIPFRVEYSSKNLVKLAPTIGLGFRHLIVSPALQGNSLEIRGITDLELSDDWKSDPTRWSLVRTKSLPVVEVDFRLVVLGVGHIRITDRNSVWELKNGRIQHFQPIVFVENLQNWTRQALRGDNNFSSAIVEFSLCKVIEKMVSDGHGGTLIIGASKDERLNYKYKTHSRVLRNAVANCADVEQELIPGKTSDVADIEVAHFARRSLVRAIDTTAALTAVDGATVIGNDLSIIGFGAEIAYEPVEQNTEVKCLARSVGVGQGTIEVGRRRMSDFGMRHRSAYGYCNQDKNAIAIVVSQDGGIRVFCTDNSDTVVLYQNVIPDRRTWGWMKA